MGFSGSCYLKANDRACTSPVPSGRLVGVSADDGKFLWEYAAGNFQLILRGDGLYAMGRLDQSKKFVRLTGGVLADLECFRGNCTRGAGTPDTIFSRAIRIRAPCGSTSRRRNVAGRIPLMRPACQDGVLVAGGQLFWGPWMCDCNLHWSA